MIHFKLSQKNENFYEIRRKTKLLTTDKKSGSPYKAMQVWKYLPVLLCKHLIFRHLRKKLWHVTY